ncbi:MAG: hypothetical protein LBR54_02710 [Oscillospiraceae bacterium]|jgi:hypothetical protein|nr:hypothetical protein [Oscillospiraceae bacterium]
MKKIAVLLLTLMMCAGFVLPVSAAEFEDFQNIVSIPGGSLLPALAAPDDGEYPFAEGPIELHSIMLMDNSNTNPLVRDFMAFYADMYVPMLYDLLEQQELELEEMFGLELDVRYNIAVIAYAKDLKVLEFTNDEATIVNFMKGLDYTDNESNMSAGFHKAIEMINQNNLNPDNTEIGLTAHSMPNVGDVFVTKTPEELEEGEVQELPKWPDNLYASAVDKLVQDNLRNVEFQDMLGFTREASFHLASIGITAGMSTTEDAEFRAFMDGGTEFGGTGLKDGISYAYDAPDSALFITEEDLTEPPSTTARPPLQTAAPRTTRAPLTRVNPRTGSKELLGIVCVTLVSGLGIAAYALKKKKKK